MGRVDKSALISKAIDGIESGRFKNCSQAAIAFGVDRTAIKRRMKGITRPRKEADSLFRQCLTSTQEQVLIKQINSLTNKGMPPTSQIVKNLAEEIRGKELGKNWVGQFVKRHSDKLSSAYLRNIGNLRVCAEHTDKFKHFFDLVSTILLTLLIIFK
jgi:hypothetical protein